MTEIIHQNVEIDDGANISRIINDVFYKRVLDASDSTADICSCSTVENCMYLKRFQKIMQKYQVIKYSEIRDSSIGDAADIINTLNYYHHLIYKNNEDSDLEFITNSLPHCDSVQCDKFERNYREKK
eukprot:239125_1